MEDDIDIEEHDVLDNPKIRDIFPDLSLVKTEVPDTIEEPQEAEEEYYEPLQYETEEEFVINIKKEKPSDDDINGCQYEQNDTICELGEIGPSNNLIPQSELVASQYEQSEINTYGYQEIEITPFELGQNESSSCRFEEDGDLHFNRIILGSKPSVDYDTLYREALHSNVSVYLENWDDRLQNSACYCNDCEILFPTVNALDAHKSISHSFLVALNTPRPNTARKSTTMTSSRYCNHCNKIFTDDTALIKHLYELLPLNNFGKPTPEPLKVDAKSTRYKCIKCKTYFATLAAGKEHKRNHHPNLANINIICKVLAKPEPSLNLVKKEHPEGKFFANNSLVPKSVLFQCYVCQINFVSCYSATQHAVKCKNYTEYNKCKICKRKIRAKDNYIHTLQHRYAEPGAKLRIYTLQKYMNEKVYLKCPKCTICFDERTFWIHYGVCGNETVNYIRCNICSININQSRYPNHKSKHVMQKCTKKDFIIIKFYDTNRINTIPKQPDDDFEEMDFEKKPLVKRERIPLYYCNVCGSYKTYPSERGHRNDACRTLKVKFCDLCGLGFSKENYKHHREHHNKGKVTLNDFKIINLKTSLEMEVPMSNFHSCKRCKIHFLSREKVQLHNCAKEPFEFCQICNKKFNLKAFVPHSNFHNHSNIPELLKKYNSINDMWNVVYSCTDCDLVTMTYDSAVEHCQNHINDIQMPVFKRCDVCEFNIIDQYYKPHMQLHTNNVKINRTKFRILTFNFEHLYSKQWMGMFSSLPKAHKYQILSKSIYRFSRLIKFNCEINSTSEDVKVFCKKCKTEVQLEDTKKHRYEKTCKSSTNYVCKFCELHFNILLDFVHHNQDVHSLSTKCKVITFNDKKDEVFDQRLKDFELTTATEDPANALTPTKSPTQPSFSQPKPFKHLTKVFPIKASQLGRNLSKLKSISANTVREEILRANRMKLYKCKKCGSCVSMLKSIAKHKCCMFAKTRLKLCYICKEYFYNRHLHLHMELHKQFPRLLKKPLVISFDPKFDSLPVANIFQCECGLHFTSKQSIDKHLEVCNDDLNISKEECSKCNLLFPTDVLVTHLCKHHSKPVDIKVQVIGNKKSMPLKCADCNIVYSTAKSYEEHLFNCRSKNGRMCSRCRLTFDFKTFSRHKCLINEKISVVKKSTYASVLYRCKTCDITYLNRKSIGYHFERKHITLRDIVPCTICKLKFTAQTYTRHIKTHSNGDTYIIKVVELQTGRTSVLKGRNKVSKERAKSESDPIEIMEPEVEMETVEMDRQENVPVNEVEKVAKSCRLFRCHQCKTCYIFKKRLDTHLASIHVAKPDSLECEVCGLTFCRKLMQRHMMIHQNGDPEYEIEVIESDTGKSSVLKGKNFNPNKNDTSVHSNKRISYFKDYNNLRSKRSRRNDDSVQNTSEENIDSVDQPGTSKLGLESVDMREDETILSDINDSLNSTKSALLNDDTVKSKTVAAHNIPEKLKMKLNANMRNYSSTLYKCKVCSLHFLTDGSILWHVSRKHDRQYSEYSCDVCGLNFTYATLQRHVYIHHKRMKLDKDSLKIRVIDENTTKIANDKPQQEGIIPQTTADKESLEKDKESLEKDKESLEKDKESLEKDEKSPNKDEEMTDKVENVVPPPPHTVDDEKDISSKIDAKIHYYKCGECNVCFIDDITCRQHCISHITLDPKTYIECKICNFQFIIDSLKDHVNVHHVGEFLLEDLVITEYLSNGDHEPKVEVYQGIDKVQSRLVSTTTEATDGCDTEIAGT